MLKRLLYIVPIILLVMTAVLVGSFYLVPTDRLNAVIARQLTDAFGSNVTLAGRPTVSLVPFLKVSFGPVKVAVSGDDNKTLMNIERASGRLSTTSLWERKPALRFIDLENAKIFLIRDATGESNWSASRFFSKDKNDGLDAPDVPELKFSKILKRISFVNSTLVIADPDLVESHILTEFNATITGPPRSADFAVKGSFMWHNELVKGAVSIEKPGAFMVGDTSSAKVSISSDAVDAIFKGDLKWAKQLRGDGTLEANIHSALEASKLLGLSSGNILPEGPIRLIGDGIFTPEAFDFRPIGIRFQDSKADGRLQLDLTGSGLGLSGTLAFDQFVFSDKVSEKTNAPSFLDALLETGQSGAKLDLRLSADTARIAGQDIQNMAVGIILNKPSLLVNIGSAGMMGLGDTDVPLSQLRGEIAIKFVHEQKIASANLTLNNMTIDALEETVGTALPLDGNASISLQASASGENAQELEDAFELKVVADIQDGMLNNFNLVEVLNADRAPDGTAINNENFKTPFKRGQIRGTINSAGIFSISEMNLQAENMNASASGRVDIAGNLLSILGSVSPINLAQAPENLDRQFTLGGTIFNPRVSSINGVPVSTPQGPQ
ncbi:MAG: AsmA family protein [Hyphomicrobiales bacterium]